MSTEKRPDPGRRDRREISSCHPAASENRKRKQTDNRGRGASDASEDVKRRKKSGSFRYMIPGCLFAAVLVVFAFRAVLLGQTEPRLPGEIAAGNSITTATVTVPALRGRIFDRNGTLLADTSYSYRLICDPQKFPDPLIEAQNGAERGDGVTYDTVSDTLLSSDTALPDTDASAAEAIPSPAVERLYAALDEYGCTGGYDSAYALAERIAEGGTLTLSDNAPMSVIAYVINDRPAGISIEKRTERNYYDGGCASHLLGHVGKIGKEALQYYSELGYPMDVEVGVDGAEAAFEQYLHGTDGKLRISYDSKGNIVSTETVSEAVHGSDVYLTLDISLQRTAFGALSEKASQVGSEGGAIVASDILTGELLVCASYPSYTYEQYKNEYQSLSASASAPLFNRAVSGRYAPGSVMKLATAAAALETGTITPDTLIEDEGVYTYYADQDFTPECWIYGRKGETHGTLNVREAIMHSCNCFFFEAGRLTGIDKMNEWALSLGLGEKSGIELPEAAPVLAGPASRGALGWGEGETLTAAIGQSDNLFTPTQLCSFISTIARGGSRMSMRLLLRVCAEDGATVLEGESEPISSDMLSDSTLAAICGGMYDSAKSGTVGAVFSGKSYDIAAKTGTAQISEEESNALFAAYAPFDDPRIAAVCVIERGSDGYNAAYPTEALLSAYFGK